MQRPPEARPDHGAPVAARAGTPSDRRVLDASRRARRAARAWASGGRCPPAVRSLEVAGATDALARARRRGPRRARPPSTAISSRPSRTTNGTTSRSRVQRRSSGRARAARRQRERRPAQDERPVVGVLELRVAVDPAVDPDVARPRRPRRCGPPRRRRPSAPRRAAGRRGSAGPKLRRIAAATPRASDARGREEEGSHAGIIGRRGIEGPGGTYPTRGP